MRVRILDQAKADLLDCGDYYRDIGGARLARTMLSRIKDPIRTLADNPESAPAYEAAPGVRRLVVANGSFLVFYRVREMVEVLHIRRAERVPATDKDFEQ